MVKLAQSITVQSWMTEELFLEWLKHFCTNGFKTTGIYYSNVFKEEDFSLIPDSSTATEDNMESPAAIIDEKFLRLAKPSPVAVPSDLTSRKK